MANRKTAVCLFAALCAAALCISVSGAASTDGGYWRISRAADVDYDVTFYGSRDGQGWAANLMAGDVARLAADMGFPNDDVSCVDIHKPGIVVVLYEDEDYCTNWLLFGAPQRYDLAGFGFDDLCSSFIICRYSDGVVYPTPYSNDTYGSRYDGVPDYVTLPPPAGALTMPPAVRTLPPPNAALPDFIPSGITYAWAGGMGPAIGVSLHFDAGIRNDSAAGTGRGFNVKWYVNDIVLGYGYHEMVPGNATVYDGNSAFDWTPYGKGTFAVTFEIDCDGHIPETNESNNSGTVYVTVR